MPGTDGSQTHHWRKTDSNLRSPYRLSATSGPARETHPSARGTGGSNLVPSSGEMLWGGRRGWQLRRCINRWSAAMPQPNDLSRSLVALDQNSTIIAVVEMSQSSWLVGGMLPGIERQPQKKLEPSAERL